MFVYCTIADIHRPPCSIQRILEPLAVWVFLVGAKTLLFVHVSIGETSF